MPAAQPPSGPTDGLVLDSGDEAADLTEMWRTIGLMATDQQSAWAADGADDLDESEEGSKLSLFSHLGSL